MSKETRKRLLSVTGQKEYKKWLEHPITVEVIKILKEESRIAAVPAAAMTDVVLAASLYHHRVGVDATLASLESMQDAPSIEEVAATYGADNSGDEK